jgi:hypothetical protein
MSTRDAQFPAMVISPSGRNVASLVAAEGATNIMIIDLVQSIEELRGGPYLHSLQSNRLDQ